MDFDQLIDSMRVGTASESIYDDLLAAHHAALDYGTSADSKVSELNGQLTAAGEEKQSLQAEISRLKAVNYDLLSSAGTANPASENEDTDDEDLSGDDADGIDGLFGEG